MRSLRYRDSRGAEGTALLEIRDGRVRLDLGDDVPDFDLAELRAALEGEAFDEGPVIPGGPGAKVGRRSA